MSIPGVLLVNLGSPDSTSVKDVRRYLDEFLMDERVLDIPWLTRRLLLSGIILRTRPKRSAKAYSKVWQDTGSPLIYISEQVKERVQLRTEAPVALGMRYGNPSIASALVELQKKGVSEIRMIPLYPHYAMSSYETVVVKAKEELAKLNWDVPLKVMPPFYEDPKYIDALVASAEEALQQDYDQILFSYHGIPERHLHKPDPTDQHCLKVDNCCEKPSEAHAYCYRHQVFATTRAFVKKAGIPEDKYRVTFQSRLGRIPWLQPYTDQVLEQLPEEGHKKILVICPSFVSDCLETLEEIAMEGKKDFEEAGGDELVAIPCMNTHERWIETLADWIHDDDRFKALDQEPAGERLLSMATAG